MNGSQQPRREMTFRDFYLAVVRHRKKALVFFMCVMTATVLITLIMPKVYVSQSKLFVRLGRENAMLDPAATLGEEAMMAMPMSRESEIASVAELLASRCILDVAVEKLGPETILDGVPTTQAQRSTHSDGFAQWANEIREQLQSVAQAISNAKELISPSRLSLHDQAVEEIADNLTAEPIRNTNVILVSYEAHDPKLAQQLVAALVDAYLEQHVRLNRTPGTQDFFAEHAERLGNELKRLEDELRELKTRTGLASVDQQREQIVTRLGRLEDDLLSVEVAQSEAQARVDSLQESLQKLPKDQVLETSTGIGNNGTDMIREKFFALQVQEKEASALYKDTHPKLRMIREELAEAERILNEQETTRTHVKTAPDASYEQTRLELAAQIPVLAAFQAKSELIEGQLADLRKSLRTLNENEIQITQLKREIELHDADYRKYAMNLEQTRIDQAMESQRMSNIGVAQPASLQLLPVRPRKALNLALGFLVAVCGAFAIAVAAESMNQSVRTTADVERDLDLPTLATIPRMRAEALRVNRRD